MRFSTALLPLTLLGLAACSGSDAAEADIFALVQEGKLDAAIQAAETQLESVEKGSEAHRDLVLSYAAALSKDEADKAKEAFLAYADDYSGVVEPKDYKYVVFHMRQHKQYLPAIDVMDAGKKRWPENATLDEVVAALKQAIASSGDEAAASKMKGLGYM